MFDYLNYINKIPLNKILETIQDIHPHSPKYPLYWINDIKRKQVEGKWVEHNNEWKWIPGPIYQYIHLWHIEIKQQGTKSKGKVIGKPRLRDIEWIKGYVHAVSRGFSGFDKDENISCHRVLINPDRDDIIPILPEYVKSTLYKPNGELKHYKDALQYLYEYLPENYGKPLYLNEAKNVIDIECRNIGKAQPLDAVVQTETGTKLFKDLIIGDKIYGDNGKLTTITGIFPQGEKDIYKISFKDGRSTECCKEHLWKVFHRGEWKIVDIERILSTQYKKDRKNGYTEHYYRIPLTSSVEYSEKELPIDPYYLGVWLGDGNSRSCGISSIDSEILNKVSEYGSKFNLTLKHIQGCDYRLTNDRGKGNELLTRMISLNLIKNKHIPEEYFYSSVNQRLELLRGLLDTDGTINKYGYITFDNVNFKLIKDVERLALSLGITTNVTSKKTSWVHKNEKKFSTSYRVHMDTDLEVFSLKRKKNRIKSNISNKRNIQRKSVAITNIEYIGKKEAACIMVNNESHLYLTNDFIVTHNTMITGNFAGHNFLTDGITDFDEYLHNKNLPTNERVTYTTQTLISAIDGKYVNNLVKHLKTGLEYLPGKKQVGETLFPPPLSKTIRGSWRVGEDVKNEYDYKVGNKWEVRGTKSGFNLRSFMDNPFAANGLRYSFGVIDEIGFMGIIEEVLGQLEECTTVDGEKYGTIWMTGTGGDFKDGGATHNVRKVFEDPKAYNCLEFDDIFENSGKKIGFFVPAWMALDEFRDEYGNVNKALALKKLNREREEKKKAKTKQAYYNLLPTKPLSWTEAFLSTSRQRFPANLIEEQIKILTEPELKKHEVGKLMFNAEGKLEFIHDFNLTPYREYPVKEFLPGAIEIFERPQDGENAPLIPFRYIIGVDPYKYDVSKEIQSIGSCIVFDRLTRRIVAEYSGRPDTTNIFYETCRKLCLFYNATLMYESNFTNMYHYFEEKRSLHLLADTPLTLRDRNTWKMNTNTSKGIIATGPINERGLEFIENYLMESLSENSDLTRTSTIRSLGLLRELRGWTPENNTDRISAFSMVVWYDITLGSLSNQEEVRERNQKKFGEYFNQFRKNPYNMSKTDMMFEKHF